MTPFFTIITCTKNSARFLPKCLTSVKSQSFRNFEHLIVDGNSTDDTLAILKKNHLYSISTPPRGIANAMNLGLAKARGQYIYFLNSDDSLYTRDVLQIVHDYLVSHPDLDWVFGNIHETNGKKTIGFPPKRKIFQGKHPNLLKFYNYIPHQGVFMKKVVFDQYGLFDETLKSMMDPEYWLRIAPHTSWSYMPITVANYLIRPDSQSENPTHRISNTREFETVQSRYLTPLEMIFARLFNQIFR